MNGSGVSSPPTNKGNPHQMKFDLSTLKAREIRDLEVQLDVPISKMFGDETPSEMNVMIGIYWIATRRKDPTFTFEQAEDVNFRELEAMELEGSVFSPPDPPEAAS